MFLKQIDYKEKYLYSGFLENLHESRKYKLKRRGISSMIEQIIKEKISADHLLYVSLKYTKTCDVILNLIKRWRIMIDDSIEGILKQAKKEKKIKIIPIAPRQKTELVKKTFKKNEVVIKTMDMNEFFKKIDKLPKRRENEFRKGVRLRITDEKEEKIIDLDTLKEYSKILEEFINFVKSYLL